MIQCPSTLTEFRAKIKSAPPCFPYLTVILKPAVTPIDFLT